MNKKTLYLHIGLRKTGTTSIQGFCANNRALLEKKGLVYPMIKLPKKHYLKEDMFNANGKYLKDLLLNKDNKKINKYFKIIRKSKAEKILISCEGFSEHSSEIFDILKLKDEFDVKVIVYLRRSVDFLTSLYQTRVRSAGLQEKCSLDTYLETTEAYCEDIKNIYLYADMFGKENIILKTFEKDKWKDNNIIIDFLNIFDVNWDKKFKVKKSKNISFGAKQIDFSILINKMNLKSYENMKLKESLLDYNDKKPTIISTLSDKKIKEIVNKHYPIECKLAKDFLNKKELFTNKYPDVYGKERPKYKGLSNEDMVNFSLQLKKEK